MGGRDVKRHAPSHEAAEVATQHSGGVFLPWRRQTGSLRDAFAQANFLFRAGRDPEHSARLVPSAKRAHVEVVLSVFSLVQSTLAFSFAPRVCVTSLGEVPQPKK